MKRARCWNRVFNASMSAVLLSALASVALLLSACDEDKTVAVVAPEAPSATKQLSGVSAAVTQARKDNAQNPDGLPKQAVDLQLSVAAAGLPAPTVDDAAKAAEVSALVFAGKIEEATRRATTAEIALAQYKEAAAKERADGEATLKRVIAEAEGRVRAAEEKAQREAYVRVVSVFAVLGGAITLIGIACAVTGWSRVGVLCIPAGIVIGGSGLLWGRPWFLWTVGGGVILCAVAAGIVWAVRVIEARKAAAPASTSSISTAAPTPGG